MMPRFLFLRSSKTVEMVELKLLSSVLVPYSRGRKDNCPPSSSTQASGVFRGSNDGTIPPEFKFHVAVQIYLTGFAIDNRQRVWH